LNSGNIQGKNIKVNPFLSLEITPFSREKVENTEGKIQIQTHLVGTYNAENIVAACCIGQFFGVENQKIKSGLENYIPSNNRSQIIQKENCTILMDAYNANPSSMKAAIENFSAIDHPDKFFVLGDMFELGDSSESEHQAIIQLAEEKKLKGIFVGKAFFSLKNDKNTFLNTTEEAKNLIQSDLKKERLYLIKGSRGMKLEGILNVLK
jgi:UDP-N-acetylmuramoyl-tripeptide--D-alanyl-D-alanine ligase